MSAGQLWQDTFSPREAEVVELLAKGMSNKRIAAELGVAESTIKFHLVRASSKVGTTGLSRITLARWWWDNVELPGILASLDENS